MWDPLWKAVQRERTGNWAASLPTFPRRPTPDCAGKVLGPGHRPSHWNLLAGAHVRFPGMETLATAILTDLMGRRLFLLSSDSQHPPPCRGPDEEGMEGSGNRPWIPYVIGPHGLRVYKDQYSGGSEAQDIAAGSEYWRKPSLSARRSSNTTGGRTTTLDRGTWASRT